MSKLFWKMFVNVLMERDHFLFTFFLLLSPISSSPPAVFSKKKGEKCVCGKRKKSRGKGKDEVHVEPGKKLIQH